MFEEIKDAWALVKFNKRGFAPSKIYKYTGGIFPDDRFIKTGAFYVRVSPKFKNASEWYTSKNDVTVVDITPEIPELLR